MCVCVCARVCVCVCACFGNVPACYSLRFCLVYFINSGKLSAIIISNMSPLHLLFFLSFYPNYIHVKFFFNCSRVLEILSPLYPKHTLVFFVFKFGKFLFTSLPALMLSSVIYSQWMTPSKTLFVFIIAFFFISSIYFLLFFSFSIYLSLLPICCYILSTFMSGIALNNSIVVIFNSLAANFIILSHPNLVLIIALFLQMVFIPAFTHVL